MILNAKRNRINVVRKGVGGYGAFYWTVPLMSGWLTVTVNIQGVSFVVSPSRTLCIIGGIKIGTECTDVLGEKKFSQYHFPTVNNLSNLEWSHCFAVSEGHSVPQCGTGQWRAFCAAM
jgi:hypothetical protein